VEDGRVVGKGNIGVPFQSALFAFLLEGEKVEAGDEVQLNLLPLSEAANQFRGGLKVSLVQGTEIAQCTAEAETPELARAMATSLAQEYIAFNQRQKAQDATQAIDFIDQQLQTTQAALLASEKALSRFKEQQRFVDLGSEASANVNKLTQTDMALQRVQSSLQGAEDLRRRLQHDGGLAEVGDLYKLGSSLGSPLLESLTKQRCTGISVRIHGLPDDFVDHGTPQELHAATQLDGPGIAAVTKAFLSSRKGSSTLELVTS
jgi:uncharacterized protein involved in exopolysaccharide biosynthesis